VGEDRECKLLKLRGVVNEGDQKIDVQRTIVDLVLEILKGLAPR